MIRSEIALAIEPRKPAQAYAPMMASGRATRWLKLGALRHLFVVNTHYALAPCRQKCGVGEEEEAQKNFVVVIWRARLSAKRLD